MSLLKRLNQSPAGSGGGPEAVGIPAVTEALTDATSAGAPLSAEKAGGGVLKSLIGKLSKGNGDQLVRETASGAAFNPEPLIAQSASILAGPPETDADRARMKEEERINGASRDAMAATTTELPPATQGPEPVAAAQTPASLLSRMSPEDQAATAAGMGALDIRAAALQGPLGPDGKPILDPAAAQARAAATAGPIPPITGLPDAGQTAGAPAIEDQSPEAITARIKAANERSQTALADADAAEFARIQAERVQADADADAALKEANDALARAQAGHTPTPAQPAAIPPKRQDGETEEHYSQRVATLARIAELRRSAELGTVAAVGASVKEMVGTGQKKRQLQRERQAARTADQLPTTPGRDTRPLIDRGTPESRQAYAEQVARSRVEPTLQDRVKAGEMTQDQADKLLTENRTNYDLNITRLGNLARTSPEDLVTRGEAKDRIEARKIIDAQMATLRENTRPEFRPLPSASAEARSAQPVEDPQRQEARQRLDTEIEALMEAGKQGPLTPEQTTRLTAVLGERQALGQSPEARRQAVLEEIRRTGTITEEQKAILSGEEDIPDAETRTPQEIEAENKKQREEIKQQVSEQLARGENPVDAIIEYNQKLAESQGMVFDPREEAATREFFNQIFGEGITGTEGKFAQIIREKFVKLGQLEVQMMQLKGIIESMKKKKDEIAKDVNAAENDYMREQDPTERIRKMDIWKQKSEGLLRYEDAIQGEAEKRRHLRIEQRKVAGFIHRKLGTKHGWENLWYGAETLGLQIADNVADAYESSVTRFA